MKLAMIAASLTALAAVPAFAVTVKNCPEKITVSYLGLKVVSDKALEKEIEELSMAEIGEVKPIKDSLAARAEEGLAELEFVLTRKEKSVCGYSKKELGDNHSTGSDETRLFTRAGRDVLRVAIDLGGKQVAWVYHTVESYKPSGIEVKQVKAVKALGYEDHGDMKYTLAWVDSFEIK